MQKVDPRRPEWRAILFAACTKEVVDTPELDPWIKLQECSCHSGASKTANPGDEYFHLAKAAGCTHEVNATARSIRRVRYCYNFS